MKYPYGRLHEHEYVSPSIRREWIEIYYITDGKIINGSPSIRREWIEMRCWRMKRTRQTSPSIRREWIEMVEIIQVRSHFLVSLHTEGVD